MRNMARLARCTPFTQFIIVTLLGNQLEAAVTPASLASPAAAASEDNRTTVFATRQTTQTLLHARAATATISSLLRLPPGHVCAPNDQYRCVDHSMCNKTEQDGGPSICICDDTYYSEADSCLPRKEQGESCTSLTTDTMCVLGAVCHAGSCQCAGQEFDFYNNVSKRCQSRGKHGEACTDPNLLCGPHAVCNGTHQCECESHNFYVDNRGFCQHRIPPDDPCTASSQCVWNARCETGVGLCKCEDNFYNSGVHRCDLKLPLGHICDARRPDQCLINGDCEQGECRCKRDFYVHQNLCHTTLAFNQSCDFFNHDLRQCASNTSCVFRPTDDRPKCACDMEHFYDGHFCVPRTLALESCPFVDVVLHDGLELGRQCVEDAHCNTNYQLCLCNDGHYARAGHCPRRIAEGGACDLWNANYFTDQCRGGLTCLYGVCKLATVFIG